ncbi:hypothetical protein [Clostridium beijerinckii]|jgi:hypothetical protein|uniref:Uncharacterized protein n=1 Tax=Clostridium beijerinckii (strain ATCC 51743 / NCIMB 8052) TaxID=290402 RepID=A6LT83_CLOB8|nr:hypothetical protein [Clostridium beijerinckii]ABR33563.1 hypothetical protein Cbei_1384 [Clostridium beijerinckii NCIMB 8052]AIU04870.1 hypothetical protein Cbs_1384 [Clostridium beijerinckii ATCC 35702]NRT67237.1 hypothetical protein [Clostridium beijerinckii]NRU52046.1 hypothetical protein [Clostridium beijerinckii]NYC48944.1 hypothetical protein [Clostridium beijerinckii]
MEYERKLITPVTNVNTKLSRNGKVTAKEGILVFRKDIIINGINTIPKINNERSLGLDVSLCLKIVFEMKYPIDIRIQVIKVLINTPFSNKTSSKVKKKTSIEKVNMPSSTC